MISLTRLAVELATSLADWTKCLLATGLAVLELATRQALHRELVCLAITVAADNTWNPSNVILDKTNSLTQENKELIKFKKSVVECIRRVKLLRLNGFRVLKGGTNVKTTQN